MLRVQSRSMSSTLVEVHSYLQNPTSYQGMKIRINMVLYLFRDVETGTPKTQGYNAKGPR